MTDILIDHIEHYLPLVSLAELPEEKRGDFDYVTRDGCDEHQPRFVFYRDCWYDVHDTQTILAKSIHDSPMGWAMYVPIDHPFAIWHAVISETFFSGVLFRINQDDTVDCGSYSS